jgi:hypothetical protein
MPQTHGLKINHLGARIVQIGEWQQVRTTPSPRKWGNSPVGFLQMPWVRKLICDRHIAFAAVVTSGVSHRCAPGAKPVSTSGADSGIHGRRKTCGSFWADSGIHGRRKTCGHSRADAAIHGRRKTCGSFWSRATVAMALSGDALNSPSPATHPPAGGGNRAVHPGHNAGFRRTAGSRCRACSPPPALRCRRRRPRTRRCRT